MNNFNSSLVTENKLFWDTIKPFFSNKEIYGAHIKLVEKNEVFQDDDLIAKKLDVFFKNAVSTLNANGNTFIANRTLDALTDLIEKAIGKCKFHPSIFLIQKQFERSNIFSFKTVEVSDIEKKLTTSTQKRQRILITFLLKYKKSSKVSVSVLHKLFNKSIEKKYKENDALDKKNVSTLPVVSKILERIMQKTS